MDDDDELHQSILDALKSRSGWETRQVQHYEMRHRGLRRKFKPFPTASDLHWPLIDTNIEKLKPLYFQQIVGLDTVAAFVPMRPQLASFTSAAEQWFDYKVREKTNLQDEALSWIDHALMSGRGVIKARWAPDKRQIRYEAIDPMYFIMPPYARDLPESDWCVHVMPMSKDAYVRSKLYKTDEETLKKITTNSAGESGQQNSEQTKRLREGITHSTDADRVIVWEVYRLGEDGKISVRTYSPAVPELDLREAKELPFDVQEYPFVDFPYEIKDRGWYSPRGIAEILAPYEVALCNTWNHKHDAMAFFNRPTLRAERDISNTANLRLAPGAILPYGLAPNAMPQPPISFDEEMTQTRAVAEQRIANPDYGMGQVINTSNRRTAREIEAISAQSAQSGDLRVRILRMALARLYRLTWNLLLQYDKDDLQYRFLEDALTVDVQALHDRYHIEPKGGLNEVNRVFLLQKAVQRKQLFMNSPWINQPELDKSILQLDDPALVKQLFQDPNQQQQNEVEDETKNLPAMLLGGPIAVKPGEDYPARIGVLMQFLQNAKQTGQSLPPIGLERILGRLDGMLVAFEQQDTNGGRQLRAQVQDYLQAAGYLPAPPPEPRQKVA